jgi:hypothetical protein
MVIGMAISVGALVLLSLVMATGTGGLLAVMAGLGLFGVGLGFFIGPNNNSAVSAAPRALSSEAAALLSLMRVFGTSIGVAAASTLLSWRIEAPTGLVGHSLGVSPTAVLDAVMDGFLMVGAFAIVAAFAATAGCRTSGPVS